MQTAKRPQRRPPTSIPQERTTHDKLIDEMDDLLDAIDEVLEDQEHLAAYRQKSGQ